VIDGNLRKIRRMFDRELSEGQKQPFDTINSTVKRITRIVENLRRLSRSDSKELNEVDVIEVIDSVAQFYEQKLKSAGVRLRKSFSSNQKTIIQANEVGLFQILTNLISNAVYAVTEVEDPEIILSCFQVEGEELVIEVSDNGHGVPEKLKTKVFEPMFTTKEVGKGTGLGLSLSMKVAEAMGGSLRLVQNEKTNFQLVFKC